MRVSLPNRFGDLRPGPTRGGPRNFLPASDDGLVGGVSVKHFACILEGALPPHPIVAPLVGSDRLIPEFAPAPERVTRARLGGGEGVDNTVVVAFSRLVCRTWLCRRYRADGFKGGALDGRDSDGAEREVDFAPVLLGDLIRLGQAEIGVVQHTCGDEVYRWRFVNRTVPIAQQHRIKASSSNELGRTLGEFPSALGITGMEVEAEDVQGLLSFSGLG